MTKERKARVVTLAVIAAALALVLARQTGWRLPPLAAVQAPQAGSSPQDAVYAMMDAARAGDAAAYLACYSGQMEASLRQSLSETTPAGFAKYLRESNAAIKGVAIAEPQALTDREVKLRVEYVYQDRNEAQTVYLEKTGSRWKIARVDGVERVKTLVPYGTPVQ
jgi:hypothetical protein